MPFIDGETLRDNVDRETQIGIDQAVKITTSAKVAWDRVEGELEAQRT